VLVKSSKTASYKEDAKLKS